MRKNTQDVLNAFLQGMSKRTARSIHTDGDRIFSYDTCLVERREDGTLLVNETLYSSTTTRQQNELREALRAACLTTVLVYDVPRDREWLAP